MSGEANYDRTLTPERALLLVFLVVLAWAPFPYGSNRAWAELALGLGFGAILLAWSGVALTGFATVSPMNRRLILPGLCVGGALAWAFLQSLDLTAFAQSSGLDIRALAHPVWSMATAALAEGTGTYISVDPESTRQAIFAAALSVAAFLIAFELARDRDRATLLLSGVIVIGFLYAAAAIASFYLKVDYQSWLMPDPKPDSGRVNGPFVNPNHFATFLSVAAIAGFGLFAEGLRQAIIWDRGARVFFRTALQALTGVNALWLAALVAILSALLLTQSRGGVIAFFAGTIALLVALSVGRKWSNGEATGQRAMAALVFAVLGIAAALSADPLLGRVRDQGATDDARASLAVSTINAIEAAPLLGHGFGAFQRYYPLFADGTVQGDVDEAHNDLLETLADLGLPAGLAFMAGPMLLAGMCFAGCLRRRRDSLFPAVGFAASVAVGLHALVDFSLQVPAVAVTYSAILGLGVAQSWRTNMDLVR
ncbi:MAG: O-antigen ligase family protein [Alphaproteobacteria bacterium]|nr:O-antigen ligase family protein [Alphaproteobacteria bacterium]